MCTGTLAVYDLIDTQPYLNPTSYEDKLWDARFRARIPVPISEQLAMAHQMTGSFNQGVNSPTSVTPVAKEKVDLDGNPLVSAHKRTYQACVGPQTPSCRQKEELTMTRFHVGAGKCAVT